MCVYVVLSETGLKMKIMQKKFREINFHKNKKLAVKVKNAIEITLDFGL